ncbi:MAG: hypothetical protein SVS15_05670 [Thermodesulfobacteriota bacterium]|nr:hypothetical protein [Thermodesulfobacteriota bacterium]
MIFKNFCKVFVLALFLGLCVHWLMPASSVDATISVGDYSYKAADRVLFRAIGDTLATRTFSIANCSDNGSNSDDHTMDIRWNSTVNYIIDNRWHQNVTGKCDLSSLATWTAQRNGTSCYYVFGFDADGNVNCTKGTEAAALGTPTWPAIPDGVAPFAAVKVDVAGAYSFTLGTDTFNCSALGQRNSTFYNLSQDPAKALSD